MQTKTLKFLTSLSCSVMLLSITALARADYSAARTYLAQDPILEQIRKSAPKTYSFKIRFDGKESVFTDVPTFHQIVISDLKSFMGTLMRGQHNEYGDPDTSRSILKATLDTYFDYPHSNLPSEAYTNLNDDTKIGVSVKNAAAPNQPIGRAQRGVAVDTYGALEGKGKNLRESIADENLKGWNTGIYSKPEDLINSWLQTAARLATSGEDFLVPNGSLDAQRISKATITEEGLDLAQLVQKFLHGSVSFSQAASFYLHRDKGLMADNTQEYDDPINGKTNFTELEHNWDQAFGYFGASRNFLAYTTETLKDKNRKKESIDTNGDGMIDLYGEKNLGISTNTGRFDSKASPSEFLQVESFSSFLEGRALISACPDPEASEACPEGYEETVAQLAAVALGAWEKTLAATVIHYLNATINEMGQYGTSSYEFQDHVKFWGEMKGYALALQFNPVGILSENDFEWFHALVGDRPALHHQGERAFKDYEVHLYTARDLLALAYGFSDSNKKQW